MKNNGFVSMTMVYTFLILFLFLMLAVLMSYSQQNKYLEAIDTKIDLKIDTKVKGDYCPYSIGQTFLFDYIGKEQSFVAECAGKYKIELWGAGGMSSGTAVAGKGAYTSGIIKFAKDTNIYIYVGERPTYWASDCHATNPNAAFNGQTRGTCVSGGGATDIRLVDGQWNSSNGLKSRIMVAAGGGGAFYSTGSAGSGGGLVGYKGSGPENGAVNIGGGQTSPNASFGIGSISTTSGGGGYYGGGSGVASNASGGSSYISGHTGCVAIASAQTTQPRKDMNGTLCAEGTTDVVCSHHYSNLVFTNTKMIDGNGYSWTTTIGEKTDMPSPTGTGTIEGNTGNGFAKITFISE